MVAFGTSGTTPKQRMTQMSAGLGLLPGVVIDQHFEQRNRIGRLLALIAQSPGLLGHRYRRGHRRAGRPRSGLLEVIGKGSVTILDPAKLETDAYEAKRYRPIMISGVDPPPPPGGIPIRPAASAGCCATLRPVPPPIARRRS